MKIKVLLVAALIGAASWSAQAGVHFGFSIGLPAPVAVVRIAAPVPAPVVVEAVPACPTPGYVWVSGYWTGYGAERAWVRGGWRPGPHVVVYDHRYYGHPWHR